MPRNERLGTLHERACTPGQADWTSQSEPAFLIRKHGFWTREFGNEILEHAPSLGSLSPMK
jgi:hypothetical protein